MKKKSLSLLVKISKKRCSFDIIKPRPLMRSGFGAGNQNRTDDLVITNDVLYRLSHTSACDFVIIPNPNAFVKPFLKNIFVFFIFCVFLAFFCKYPSFLEQRTSLLLTFYRFYGKMEARIQTPKE